MPDLDDLSCEGSTSFSATGNFIDVSLSQLFVRRHFPLFVASSRHVLSAFNYRNLNNRATKIRCFHLINQIKNDWK